LLLREFSQVSTLRKNADGFPRLQTMRSSRAPDLPDARPWRLRAHNPGNGPRLMPRNEAQVRYERAPSNATPGQLPRIRTEEVASVSINLPTLAQQTATVARINDEFTQSTRLTEALSARLTALDHLPAALLREAFAGRL
jgi:hypothetical protein